MIKLNEEFDAVWNDLGQLNEEVEIAPEIAAIKEKLRHTTTTLFYEDVHPYGYDVELDITNDKIAECLVRILRRSPDEDLSSRSEVSLWKYVELHFDELVELYQSELEDSWYDRAEQEAVDMYADACDRAYDEAREPKDWQVTKMDRRLYESLTKPVSLAEDMTRDDPYVLADELAGAHLEDVLHALIRDEYEAVEGYKQAIAEFEASGKVDEGVIKVLTDIANEEYTHIGQLEKLQELVSTAATSIEAGRQEAEAQLNGTEE